MLEIESGLISKLDEIEVSFPELDDKAKDDNLQFLLIGGLVFPIIKVSKTILNVQDISTFILKLGWSNQIPVANVIFKDSAGQFRETDYINADTDVRVWLGASNVDEKPINLNLHPVDVAVKNAQVILTCKLAVPTEHISICNDTVENMLKDFASKTKLGIRCNYDDVLAKTVIRNFIDISPEDFIKQFCEHIGITNWFIDGQYNLCLLDLQQSIDSHEDKECSVLMTTSDELDEPEKVIYTNLREKNSQFSFEEFGYDFVDVDNAKPDKEAVIFDKSFAPDLTKFQAIEGDFVDKPTLPDTDCLYFEADFDPFKQVGRTFNIEVYTGAGLPKRATLDEVQDGEQKPTGQMLIEDVTGVYMLTDVKYMYTTNPIKAWTSFSKVSDKQVDSSQ